jgi:hypothetical protein
MSFDKFTAGFRQFKRVQMTLDAPNWWDAVPAAAGWYLIETNTLIAMLDQLPAPSLGSNLYNIPHRIQFSACLRAQGLAIQPACQGAPYFVYCGEQANLRNRAREHTHGNPGTGCLSLSLYPQLRGFEWWFWYLPCDTVFPESHGNKALRVMGEQTWRAHNGWPVLCKE